MGSKLLTEASFFNCAGNPAIQIYGKDHLQIIASDKAAHILTDKSRCGVIAPLTCAILTAKAGGMTPVPCELNEAMPVSWIDADTIVKIKGNAALSEKSYCKCPVCPESNITPVYTDSISVLTPVQAIADISSGKSDSRSEDNDCSGGDTKENRKSSSDASVKEEPVKQKAEETEPDDKEDDAFSKYCRCDY
ncbi:MAG: hypothetical protein IJ446_03145, partial [Oscillospiraceae bacterium]|nr:hypothetical protein [Oscillospiraceae bacterium]